MPFSTRVSSELHPNRLTEVLREMRARGEDILDLTQSNPTDAGIVYPVDLLASLNDRHALHYDPQPFGLRSAREAIAAAYRAPFDSVAMTASTSEAYSWLFKLLCNAGDQVLIPRPSYPLFEYLATLENVEAKHYSLFYDHGWFIDFHTIEREISARTRAIVLVNPNNPTGHFIRQHELDQLRGLCAERQLAIISDEVFQDYSISPFPDSVTSLFGTQQALTFCLNGLSKTVGLPQMKLAWILCDGPPDVVDEARARLEVIADTFLSAGTPVQLALPKLLDLKSPVQQQIRTRCAINLRKLTGSGMRSLRTEAGWYAVVVLPTFRTEGEWIELFLTACKVLVQPGYFYDFERPGFAVVSLLTHPDIFGPGVDALATALQ